MAKNREWFRDEQFWELYAPIMFDQVRWAEVPRVADGIERLVALGPGPGASAALAPPSPERSPEDRPCFLDLCCGFGRISLELARRGYNVTGLDITPAYIKTAREDAAYEKLTAEFVTGDVRSFRRPGTFDVALNLYISFGYFDDPADDIRMLKNAYDSLKEGGTLIIETLGKEIAVRDFTEGEWFERAGMTVMTQYECVDAWDRLRNRWILMGRDGRTERSFEQRLYAASELEKLLRGCGFSAVHSYGDWDASPYDRRARMLIAVARK